MKLQNRSCPICGEKLNKYLNGYPIFVREFSCGPTVRKCTQCGFVFLNPVMTEESYLEFYNNDDQKAFAQNIANDNYDLKVSINDLRRVGLMHKYIDYIGEVLDVGTGRSNFVSLMKNATGIDISEKRISKAMEAGLPVYCCDIFDWNKKVSTVTLFHVLEHILEPHKFLAKINKILYSSGTLVIEVPNVNDILIKLKSYEKFYYQNAHCSYFSPDTIKRLVEDCGFIVEKEISIQRYSLDNHLHWLFKNKPGKVKFKLFNCIYSWFLKFICKHDTIFLICKKENCYGK
jgi:SAM-dependent methyltransferase